jgi:hypothetical protein
MENDSDSKVAAVIQAAEELLLNARRVRSQLVRQPYEYRVSEYSYDNLKFHLNKLKEVQ